LDKVKAMAKIPRSFIFIAAAIVAGILLFALVLSTREPHYHGQPLSYWTIKLKQGNRKEQAEARDALRTMGKSAVPYLINAMQKLDPPLKLKIMRDYGARFPFLYRWLRLTSDQDRSYAASALGEIGPSASNAIPSLLKVTFKVSMWQVSPSAALMKIRGEPIDGLIQALDNTNTSQAQWVLAAQTLAEFGTNARPAIPALCRALASTNGWAAAYAIGFVHSNPEIAVPALMNAISAFNSGRAMNPGDGNIIWALGQFEGDARPAIPILRQYLIDPNPMIRQSVLSSLQKILPPEELKSLVPDLLQNANDPEPNLSIPSRMLLKQIDPAAAKKAGVE
jgi:HEAT repeat protein